MQNIFNYLIGMAGILAFMASVSLWLVAMLLKSLDSCYKTSLLFFFVPPIAILYGIFMLKVESMRICHLSDKDAFLRIVQSFKRKPEICLKR